MKIYVASGLFFKKALEIGLRPISVSEENPRTSKRKHIGKV